MNEEISLLIRTIRRGALFFARSRPSDPPKWLLIPLLSLLFFLSFWWAMVHPAFYAAASAQGAETHPVLLHPRTATPTAAPPAAILRASRSTALTGTLFVTPTYVPYESNGHGSTPDGTQLNALTIVQGPSLIVTKTVGLDPGNCATNDTITVTRGTQVVYCYFVLNTGTVTFSYQSVVDSHLGVLLADYPFVLTPQSGNKPAALFTLPSIITQTTTNVVTWTASSTEGEVAFDTDSATVNVVSLQVTKTVGIKEDECAVTTAITVTRSTPVYYCYIVENTSSTPLVRHTAQDSELGIVWPSLDYSLAPGEQFNTVDAGYIISDTEITSRTGTVTWKAFTQNGLAPVGVASADVYVPDLVTQKTVGIKEEGCAANSAISVLVGTEVVYCYTAVNTGSVALTSHTVVDSQQGMLLEDEPFVLAPGASVLFTTTQVLTSPTTSEMTWTATANVQPLGGFSGTVEAQAQSRTTVSVIPRANFTAIVFDDLDKNGLQRDPEPGLSNAQVTLVSASGDQIFNVTDATGRSAFSGLAPGSYTVTIDIVWPGGSAITTTANVPTRIVLAGGESKSELFGFDVSDRVLLPLIVQ